MSTVAEAYVPALLEPYPTLRTLYRAVVDNPAEDEPRLQFGDAAREAAEECREVDRQPLTAWADLIDVQFKIHRLGKPHKKVVECSHLVKRGGPDYFTCEVDDVAGFEPGDRIDFELHPAWASTWGMKRKYPGLLVRRIDPIDAYKKILILVRDENSKPFPDKELRELWGHECGLVAELADRIMPGLQPMYAHCERGFVSKAELAWANWAADGDRLVKWFPLTEVKVTTGIPVAPTNASFGSDTYLAWHLFRSPALLCGAYGKLAQLSTAGVIVEVTKTLKQRWPSVVSWRFPGVSL